MGQKLARMADETIHEGELVRVFLGSRRVSVRQVEARQPQRPLAPGDHRLDIARLDVAIVAGQAALDLERMFRQDRHAVEGLLPMGGDIVAERLDLLARERLVHALDLLQADRIRRDLLEIVEEMGQALAHRIDVPGRDNHGRHPRTAGIGGEEAGRRGGAALSRGP